MVEINNAMSREQRVRHWLSEHRSLHNDDYETFATMIVGMVDAEVEGALEFYKARLPSAHLAVQP